MLMMGSGEGSREVGGNGEGDHEGRDGMRKAMLG